MLDHGHQAASVAFGSYGDDVGDHIDISPPADESVAIDCTMSRTVPRILLVAGCRAGRRDLECDYEVGVVCEG